MKKSLICLAVVLFFISCEKDTVPFYSDVDRINFVGFDDYDEDNPDYMYVEKNFLAEPNDTAYFTLEVKLQGKIAEYDREVYFIQKDSTKPGLVLVADKCVIPAGEVKGVCEIGIVRPAEVEREFISFLCFDYENSDFLVGTPERQKFMVKAFDAIPAYSGINEDTWNDFNLKSALGRWSDTKARFICRTLGILDFYDWCYSSGRWDMYQEPPVCYDKEILEEALEVYKSNPVNVPLYDETLLPEEVWISFDVE